MACEEAAVAVQELHAEAVRAVQAGWLRRAGRYAHVLGGGVRQQERGEAGQVGGGGPELAGRGEQAGVLGGLREQDVGPRVDGPAGGVRGDGCGVVRVMPSGSRISLCSTASQGSSCSREISAPSRAYPGFE